MKIRQVKMSTLYLHIWQFVLNREFLPHLFGHSILSVLSACRCRFSPFCFLLEVVFSLFHMLTIQGHCVYENFNWVLFFFQSSFAIMFVTRLVGWGVSWHSSNHFPHSDVQEIAVVIKWRHLFIFPAQRENIRGYLIYSHSPFTNQSVK